MHGWRDTARPPGARSSICGTQIRVGGETVWSEISTFLARRTGRSRTPHMREAGLPHLQVPPRQDVNTSTFVVAPGVGRQYARVSGDFNPIHIAAVAARFFGFKRALAHGMWSLARCAAELPRTRVFTALHAGCGFQATHCVPRPHRARELDGRPTRGFRTCAIRRLRATIRSEAQSAQTDFFPRPFASTFEIVGRFGEPRHGSCCYFVCSLAYASLM
jgi:hypothetical protein